MFGMVIESLKTILMTLCFGFSEYSVTNSMTSLIVRAAKKATMNQKAHFLTRRPAKASRQVMFLSSSLSGLIYESLVVVISTGSSSCLKENPTKHNRFKSTSTSIASSIFCALSDRDFRISADPTRCQTKNQNRDCHSELPQ